MPFVFDPMKYGHEPGATVIRALGGVRPLARKLGVTPEAVSQWARPTERGGSNIPRRRWPDILRVAREMGKGAVVTPKLLRQKKRVDMGRASKVKGDRFEWQVVRELHEEGLAAHRVPLSGAVKGYPGDIRVDAPSGPWVLQCKISGYKYGSGGRVGMSRMLGEVSAGLVTVKSGARYVVMRRDVFVLLLRGEPPRFVNLPEMRAAGGQVEAMLKGHDALVFRNSGVREWFALVPESRFAA